MESVTIVSVTMESVTMELVTMESVTMEIVISYHGYTWSDNAVTTQNNYDLILIITL